MTTNRREAQGAILADGNVFTKQYSEIFAAFRMKYALSLQMGTRQVYQRPPSSGRVSGNKCQSTNERFKKGAKE